MQTTSKHRTKPVMGKPHGPDRPAIAQRGGKVDPDGAVAGARDEYGVGEPRRGRQHQQACYG